MKRRATALLAAVLLAANGGAHAIFDDDVARAQIQELRRQVETAAKLVEERLGRVQNEREHAGGAERATPEE